MHAAVRVEGLLAQGVFRTRALALRRQALSFVQGPWIVAQLPTASGNTVLQPS